MVAFRFLDFSSLNKKKLWEYFCILNWKSIKWESVTYIVGCRGVVQARGLVPGYSWKVPLRLRFVSILYSLKVPLQLKVKNTCYCGFPLETIWTSWKNYFNQQAVCKAPFCWLKNKTNKFTNIVPVCSCRH